MVEDEKRRHLELNSIEKDQFRQELRRKDEAIENRERVLKELA